MDTSISKICLFLQLKYVPCKQVQVYFLTLFEAFLLVVFKYRRVGVVTEKPGRDTLAYQVYFHLVTAVIIWELTFNQENNWVYIFFNQNILLNSFTFERQLQYVVKCTKCVDLKKTKKLSD